MERLCLEGKDILEDEVILFDFRVDNMGWVKNITSTHTVWTVLKHLNELYFANMFDRMHQQNCTAKF